MSFQDLELEWLLLDDVGSTVNELTSKLSGLSLLPTNSSLFDPSVGCAYCSVFDRKAVARCCCGRIFCNGYSGSGRGSHLVNHMRSARHKELRLDGWNPFDYQLKCHVCSSANVFALGFVAALNGKKRYRVVCNKTCLKKLDGSAWDLPNWAPLIKGGRCFDNAVLKFPTGHMQPVSSPEIARLESIWAFGNKDATLRSVASEPLPSIPLTFPDAATYCNLFLATMAKESHYQQKQVESSIFKLLNVSWDPSEGVFSFPFPIDKESKILELGSRLRLRLPNWPLHGDIWQKMGTVKLDSDNKGSLWIHFKDRPTASTDERKGFELQPVYNSICFDRTKAAIMLLQTVSSSFMGPGVKRTLLSGKSAVSLPRIPGSCDFMAAVLSLPSHGILNESQTAAVWKALGSDLSLIVGPPGTGKTMTAATLVSWMLSKEDDRVRPSILVCAPSNTAVDNLMRQLKKAGLSVYRALSSKQIAVRESKANKKTLDDESSDSLSSDSEDPDEFIGVTEQKKKEPLGMSKADIICCTCMMAGHETVGTYRFTNVLIDEASQATEPEILIPLLRARQRAVLVGDHVQLGPIVSCEEAKSAGLGRSMFERLIMAGLEPALLETQHRMHPSISAFPSRTFYAGRLRDGIQASDRIIRNLGFRWPVPEIPMLFLKCENEEELSSTRSSYLNRSEAQRVLQFAQLILDAGLSKKRIGVITPYEGQRAHLRSIFSESEAKGIEIDSVDAFQGREKDVVIFTCVRCNSFGETGFLTDKRRLNVALTRAKYALILIGSVKTLYFVAKEGVWRDLISDMSYQGLLVEGPIEAMRQCSLDFVD